MRQIDPKELGAVYGIVGTDQMRTNVMAVHAARDVMLAAGGGLISLSGKLFVDDRIIFDNLGQTGIALSGDSMLFSGLYYGGAGALDILVSLRGTSYFRMDNLTINGGFKAEYGLLCARNGTGEPAGKHTFTNIRVVECAKASHINHASEENAYIKCQFQRSPVGAVFSAYPLSDGISIAGETPADFDGGYTTSIAHHLYDCALGSEAYTTRCGLMVLGSMVKIYGGAVQTASSAEAAVIVEGTRRQCAFRDVDIDGNLAPIGYKIGYYTHERSGNDWNNRVIISGHITIHPSTGIAYIYAYRLCHSIIESLSFNGPASVDIGINLLDSMCRGNVFTNCMHDDNRPVKINRIDAGDKNIMITDGCFSLLAHDQSISIRYDTSVPGRFLIDGGLYIYPNGSVYPITYRRQGEAYPRYFINADGVLAWGGGSSNIDVTLFRGGADILKTPDKFVSAELP